MATFDPTDLYDQNLSTGDQPTNPPKTVKAIGSIADVYHAPEQYEGGTFSQRQASDYTGYLPWGLVETPGRNPELERGEAQPGWEKFGNTLAQTGGKFVTGLVDMVGGMGSLLTEWGDDRDYRNSFTNVADAGNEWIDKNFPLYRSTEGTFGLTDASWWGSNFAGLTSSVGSFAIGGMGIAKILGTIGKSMSLGSRLTSALVRSGIPLEGTGAAGLRVSLNTASNIVNTGEEVLSAGLLAYSEGAMSGRVVYDKVYQERLSQGDSEEVARHHAAQAAATTVQLNTVINTGLNMLGGMGKFFNHEKDAIYRTARNNFKQMAGETEREAAERIAKSEAKDYASDLGFGVDGKSLAKRALTSTKESFAEGLEELTNQFAETAGVEEGKKGKDRGFFDQFDLMERYLQYTMNEEGALNFALGAVAGPIQQSIVNHIPMHKVALGTKTNSEGQAVDADGKVVDDVRDAAVEFYENGKRVSSAKKNRILIEKDFNNIKKRVVDDLNYIATQKEELEKAKKSGDTKKVNEIQNSLFNLMNTNAVAAGMGANLKETYRSILDIDNTKTDTEEVSEKLDAAVKQMDAIKAAGGDTTGIEAEITKLKTDLAATTNQTAAMRLGFASSTTDNKYKDRAKRAMELLDKSQANHDKLFAQYGMDKDNGNPEERHVFDFLFKLSNDRLATQMDLEDARKEQAEKDESDSEIPAEVDEYDRVYKALRRKKRANRVTAKRALNFTKLKEQLKVLLAEPDSDARTKKAEDLVNAMGIPVAMEGEEVNTILNRIMRQVQEKERKLYQEHKDTVESTLTDPAFEEWSAKTSDEDFKAWQAEQVKKGEKLSLIENEDKLKMFWEQLGSKLGETLQREEEALSIAELEDRVDMMDSLFKEMSSRKGIRQLMKNSEKFFDKLNEKYKRMQEASKKKREEKYAPESEVQAYNRKVKNRLLKIYGRKIAQVEGRISKLIQEIQEVQQKIADNPDTAIYSMRTLEKLKKELKAAEAELKSYQKYVGALRVSVVTPVYTPPAGTTTAPPPPPGSTPPPPPGGTPPPPPGGTPPSGAPPPPSGGAAPSPETGTPPGPEPTSEERTPASFAAELAAGKKLETPEDLEYYQNNAKAIEEELQKLASNQDSKNPTEPEGPAPTDSSQPKTVADIGIENINVGGSLGAGRGLGALILNGQLGTQSDLVHELRGSAASLSPDGITVIQKGDTLILAIKDNSFDHRGGGFLSIEVKGATEDTVDMNQLESLLFDLKDLAQQYAQLNTTGLVAPSDFREVQEGMLSILQDYAEQRPEVEGAEDSAEPGGQGVEERNEVEVALDEAEVARVEFADFLKELVKTGKMKAGDADPKKESNIYKILTAELETAKAEGRPMSLKLLSTDGVLRQPLSPEDSAKLVRAYETYQTALNKALQLSEQSTEQAVSSSVITMTQSPDTTTGVDPIFANVEEGYNMPELDPTRLPKKSVVTPGTGVTGQKQQSPATSGSNKTTTFFEVRGANGVERVSTNRWNPRSDSKVLQHDQLTPGTVVKVHIDTNYSGTRKAYSQDTSQRTKAGTEVEMTFEQFLDKDGLIKTDEESINNIPIGMTVPGESAPSQWLHSVDWIRETDPRANPDTDVTAFRNVYLVVKDESGNDITTPEDVKKHVEYEAQRLFNIRKAMVEAYNRGVKAGKDMSQLGFETVVTEKEGGVLNRTAKSFASATTLVEHTVVGGTAKMVLTPMAFVRDTAFLGIPGHVAEDIDLEPGSTPVNYEGAVVSLVRMANGKRRPVALYGKKMAEHKDTIVPGFMRAFLVYLNATKVPDVDQMLQGKGEAALIQQNTGFNIASRGGFRDFMIQYYTYFSQADSDKDGVRIIMNDDNFIVLNREKSGSTSQFVIDIDAKGNLTPEAVEGLTLLLERRTRNVQIAKAGKSMRGLGEGTNKKFTEARFVDGKWAFPKYESYEHFLASELETNIQALNAMDGGVEFVDKNGNTVKGMFYGSNPVIKYDFVKVVNDSTNFEQNVTVMDDPDSLVNSEPKVQDAKADAAETLSIFDEAEEERPTRERPEKKSVGTKHTAPVSFESLTNLRNFTPESERNGKSVEEVLSYLKLNHITHLADGYNPFKRCS